MEIFVKREMTKISTIITYIKKIISIIAVEAVVFEEKSPSLVTC